MKLCACISVLFAMLWCGAPAFAVNAPQSAPAATDGSLVLSVIVVDDLVPRAVPFTDFTITDELGSSRTVRTDGNGTLQERLSPGSYTIESGRPVIFKSRSLTWKSQFRIQAGQTTKLELTDGDALVTAAVNQVSDEAEVYEQTKSGVVTVECDFGSGSGFVVDKNGLVMTSQHVTNGTRWAALRFGRGMRVNASVIEEDKQADVAILRFNPNAVGNFSVLPLADTTHGPIAVEGEKVLAIGSPLHQEKVLTTGIVSRVEDGVLISDVNANHGNSGGPLLDLTGHVLGLVTFLDTGTGSDANGPGISGIVSVQKAIPVLERALGDLSSAPLPSNERLPDISPVPIPTSAIDEAATKQLKPIVIKKPSNFETIIYTPFIMASMAAADERAVDSQRNRRSRRRGENGVRDQVQVAPSRFWERYAIGMYDAVVPVMVRPALKETSKSFWTNVATIALVGVPSKRELRFRDDFYDMELYRGGTMVQPVRRSRDTVARLYDSEYVKVNDTAYGGVYSYDPSAFEPSQPVVLKIREESNIKQWHEVPISAKEQQQIWDSFADYRSTLNEKTASSQTSTGLDTAGAAPVTSAPQTPGPATVSPVDTNTATPIRPVTDPTQDPLPVTEQPRVTTDPRQDPGPVTPQPPVPSDHAVAAVDGDTVTLNVGAAEGLRVGDRVGVQVPTDILDPTTHAVLETRTRQVILRVTSVGKLADCVAVNATYVPQVASIKPGMKIKWWSIPVAPVQKKP